MNKYIKVYETICPDDIIADDDTRRDEIIAEMKAIEKAKSTKEAAKIIAWWCWDSPGDCTRWVTRARKLMAKT